MSTLSCTAVGINDDELLTLSLSALVLSNSNPEPSGLSDSLCNKREGEGKEDHGLKTITNRHDD